MKYSLFFLLIILTNICLGQKLVKKYYYPESSFGLYELYEYDDSTYLFLNGNCTNQYFSFGKIVYSNKNKKIELVPDTVSNFTFQYEYLKTDSCSKILDCKILSTQKDTFSVELILVNNLNYTILKDSVNSRFSNYKKLNESFFDYQLNKTLKGNCEDYYLVLLPFINFENLNKISYLLKKEYYFVRIHSSVPSELLRFINIYNLSFYKMNKGEYSFPDKTFFVR